MKPHPLALLAAAGVAAAASACGGSSSGGTAGQPVGGATSPAAAAQHPTSLIGEVGKDDRFVIELHDEKGSPITNLAAGSYSLKVEDDSGIHNFHLSGEGIDDTTGVAETGTKTFQVTFKPGKYTFVCDPHAGSMKGSFTVS